MCSQTQYTLEEWAQDLKCPICLEVFVDPVTYSCGKHNYCKGCLEEHHARKARKCCPVCNEQLLAHYVPQKNVTLCNLADALRSNTDIQRRLQPVDDNATCERSVDEVFMETACLTDYCSESGNQVSSSSQQPQESQLIVSGGPQAIGEFGSHTSGQTERFKRLTFSHSFSHRSLTISECSRKVQVRKLGRVSVSSNNRFDISQVMTEQEFCDGVHYWEVCTAKSTGWAVGVAYSHLGRGDKLGRTKASWCLEWSSGRLCYWHNGTHVAIKSDRPTVVRVVLDMDSGLLAFYSMCDCKVLLHSAQVCFTESVRPAFWLYGLEPRNTLSFTDG